jgi:chemotaxis protein MotB
MQRLPKRAAAVRHDRWLLSYADIVTLLFAVFAVFFLLEKSGKYTSRQVLDAVVARPHISKPVAPALPPAPKPVSPLLAASKTLVDDLHDDIAQGKVDVRLEPRGLVISLGQASFFRSGRAEVDPAVYPTIDRLADRIGRMNNPIRLEGHTDNVPIQSSARSRFKSNWELSAARSIAMLELLANRNGIARNRLSIAGFADTEPLTTNEDAAGRAHNRRVDVIVLDAAPR